VRITYADHTISIKLYLPTEIIVIIFGKSSEIDFSRRASKKVVLFYTRNLRWKDYYTIFCFVINHLKTQLYDILKPVITRHLDYFDEGPQRYAVPQTVSQSLPIYNPTPAPYSPLEHALSIMGGHDWAPLRMRAYKAVYERLFADANKRWEERVGPITPEIWRDHSLRLMMSRMSITERIYDEHISKRWMKNRMQQLRLQEFELSYHHMYLEEIQARFRYR